MKFLTLGLIVSLAGPCLAGSYVNPATGEVVDSYNSTDNTNVGYMDPATGSTYVPTPSYVLPPDPMPMLPNIAPDPGYGAVIQDPQTGDVSAPLLPVPGMGF